MDRDTEGKQNQMAQMTTKVDVNVVIRLEVDSLVIKTDMETCTLKLNEKDAKEVFEKIVCAIAEWKESKRTKSNGGGTNDKR